MYQRTVLPNGVRVVSEFIPHVRSAAVGVWFEVGSRDEDSCQQGFSHLIEHLVFKGSEKYSQRQISELIDLSGGQLEAFTGKEYTCYYARVLDEEFSVAADLLAEMLLTPLFAEPDIVKERGVILEELSMYEDSPDELVHDLLCEVLYRDHPLGTRVLGTKESIDGASRANLLEYMSQFYTADRLVIAVAGHVEHSRVVEELAARFAELPRRQAIEQEAPTVAVGQYQSLYKDTEQIHMCLGGPAIGRFDPRKYQIHILDTIVGGSVSSRLFQELREEKGFVYSTYSYHSSYRDAGNYGVYAAFNPAHRVEVMETIHTNLTKLMDEPVEEVELERAKSQLRGGFMLALESTTNRMTRLAKSEMNYGRLFSLDELMDEIDKVTSGNIQALAQEIYGSKQRSETFVGPACHPLPAHTA